MKKKLTLVGALVVFLSLSLSSQLQSVRIDANQTGICEGDSLELILDINIQGVPELRIEWSPDIGISDLSSDRPKVSPPVTTTYKVIVYDETYGGQEEDTFKVTVVPIPNVVAPDDDSVCVNETYKLAPKLFDSSLEIQWTVLSQNALFENSGDNVSFDLAPVLMPQPDFIGDVVIEIKGSGIDFCSAVRDTLILSYVEGTTGAEISVVNDSVCSHEKVLVQAQASNYESFEWSHDGDGYFENANTLSPFYIPDTDESGTINIFFDVYGRVCNFSDSIALHISEMDVVPVNDIIACKGEIRDIGVRFSDNLNYSWNTGDDDNFIRIQAETDRLFVVEVTNGEGCYFTDSIFMEVLDIPEIEIDLDFENQTIYIDPTSLERYVFSGNKTNALQDGMGSSYYYGDVVDMYDTIYVKAYDENECSNTDQFIVLPTYKKVTAFSPNGDGINDRLHQGNKITVFDRTHNILYEGWEGWDGTNNGKELPQGTYFYVLYYEDGSVFYKGPVTLVR